MRWMIPYDQLSQKQYRVLTSITSELSRAHWVQGFAGSGKTIVLTHLIERVASLDRDATLCFITYTHALKDLVATGISKQIADRVVVKTHTRFMSDHEPFDFVFLDEVQDISPSDLQRIRSLSRNLYIAGDPDQRIYVESAHERQIEHLIAPRSWHLTEIFRLSRLLKAVALHVFSGARVVEGSDAMKGAEVSIRLMKADTPLQEAIWVWNEARRRARPGYPSAILLPTHSAIQSFASLVATYAGLPSPPEVYRRDYSTFNEYWRSHDLPLSYLGNGHGSLPTSDMAPMVYLMTFHSAKGLDFDNVFIPRMNEHTSIVHRDALRRDPELDRRLLFVAVTRSRENLFLSYSSTRPHPYLVGLPGVVASRVPTEAEDVDADEEFF